MIQLNRGYLIVFEGIDGSGKTSLSRSLTQALETMDVPALQTREPGGSELGSFLRPLLQQKKFTAEAEFLLFAADRAQHIHQVVKPALDNNMIVISDRMADSSYAYQGYGRGLDLDLLERVNRWVMKGITPDLLFYCDITIQVAIDRIVKRNEAVTTFEREKREFFERVIHGFNTIFATRSNVIRLNGEQPLEQLSEQVIASAKNLIGAP